MAQAAGRAPGRIEAGTVLRPVAAAGPDTFALTYTDGDQAAAAAVPRALLDAFEARAREAGRDALEARRVLDGRIVEAGRGADDAERRLAAFRRDNLDLLPGGRGYLGRLQEARADAASARAELDAARARREGLRRELDSVPPARLSARSPDEGEGIGATELASPDIASGALAARLIGLERRLDELRTRGADQGPEGLAVRQAIAGIRAQIGGTAAPRREAASGARPDAVQDQLRLDVAQLEGAIAGLEERATGADRRVMELERLSRAAPDAEAEDRRLAREAADARKAQGDLAAERDRLVRAAEAGPAGAPAFEILRAPGGEGRQVGPPRSWLITAALGLSVVAGLAAALAPGIAARPFETVRQLERAYPWPVLGALGDAPGPRARRRRRWAAAGFALAAGTFLTLFAGLAAAEGMGWLNEVRGAVHRAAASGRWAA